MDLKVLKNNLIAYISESANDSEIQHYIDNMNTSDNYVWEPYTHLKGDKSNTPNDLYQTCVIIKKLANGYNDQLSKYYHDNTIASKAISAIHVVLSYYKKSNKIGNWWEWHIGIPYQLLCSLLILDPNIKYNKDYKSAFNYFVRQFAKAGDLTYANQASICRNLYMYGVLLEDADIIEESMKLAGPAFESKTVKQIKAARCLQNFYMKHPTWPHAVWMFAGKEGLYSDGTFIQHTSIPYIATYGIEMMEYVAMLLKTSNNSNLIINQTILQSVPKWVRSYNIATFDNQFMRMYMGRSIDNSNARDRYNTLNRYINIIKETNCELDNYYVIDMEGSGPVKIPTNYSLVQYNGDRAIHQREGWRFGLSMSSDRIAHYESFNNQNIHGWHQGSGVTYLYSKLEPSKYNETYFNDPEIYNYLPGTTVSNELFEVKESKQPLFDYNEADSKYARAGGVTLCDEYSLAIQVANVKGRDTPIYKSWFMAKNRIGCLGSHIYGDCYTVIENYLGAKNVYTIDDNKKKLYTTNTHNDFKLFEHDALYIDGVAAYVFPNKTQLCTKLEDGHIKFMTLHDRCSLNEYSYIIYPYENVIPDIKDKINMNICGSHMLSSIRTPDYHMYDDNGVYAIAKFNNEYSKHTICLKDNSFELILTNKCSVILDTRNDDTLRFAISDYTHDLNKIDFQLSNEFIIDSHDKVITNVENGITKVSVNCKDSMGSPIKFTMIKSIAK